MKSTMGWYNCQHSSLACDLDLREDYKRNGSVTADADKLELESMAVNPTIFNQYINPG